MNKCRQIAIFCLLLGVCQTTSGEPADPSPQSATTQEFFNFQIKPLLAARCQKCHGATSDKGGLSLASKEKALAGGDTGPVVVPGKPEESLLIQAVGYADDSLQMPPDGKLSDEQIGLLTRWVKEGAEWSDETPVTPPSPEHDAESATAVQSDLWSLQPVREVAPPAVRYESWTNGPIDRFILARLEEAGLMPSEPADKRTLLRRATFDLTGLPPSPEEIEAFLADDSPSAFANVVDRLLASPRYGERWGRHWLDVVRYADARDLMQLPVESDFREAWRYRDWVVNAFNRDLPYNEFVTLQLAGDLLQPADQNLIDPDALVATGMLAIADFIPGDVDKEKMIADYVNDQIDVVGRAVLGLTLACARCHDHKFDPISTKDYYALAGIFFSTKLIPGPVPGNTPILKSPLLSRSEIQAMEAQAKQDKERLAEVSAKLATESHREYLSCLRQLAASVTVSYLTAAWEYNHPETDKERPSLHDFAAAKKLDEGLLTRWQTYLQSNPHPVLSQQLAAADRASNEHLSQELGQKLAEVTARRQEPINDPVAQSLADTALVCFRADDPRIVKDGAGQITRWPDRAGILEDATIVANHPGPVLATATIGGHSRPVVRFDGKQLLQIARTSPKQGALFAVFRASAQAPPAQRLMGWEDSSVGQHGVGLLCDADGAIHAALRNKGAFGDVRAPAMAPMDFQLLSITWGPRGVTVHRNGVHVATNSGIDAVSSDPEIVALRIGGPGSGTAPLFHGDLAELQIYNAQLDEVSRGFVEAELQKRWLGSFAAQDFAMDPLEDLFDELSSSRGPYWVEENQRDKQLAADARERLAPMRAEVAKLKKKSPPVIPQAVVVQDGGPPGTDHAGFQDAWVNIRGNPAKRGPVVARGFPRALAGENQPTIREGSGRRELAEWLTSPNHPLTARVMANRVWQYHFGEGLVRTSANFGNRGDRPSHPELLDYLARQFIASGWSIKSMHRQIMLSSAYQQSSRTSKAALATDPENRLLGRMNVRRLEAEAIRDQLLAVAGRLDFKAGGPGSLEMTVPRRSLYLMSVRSGNPGAFGPLFDAANCSAIVEQRNNTTVAPQALFLMNNKFIADLAEAVAGRITREVPTNNDEQRIDRLYNLVLSRPPTSEEIEIGQQFLADPSQTKPWARYCQIVLLTNEVIYVE